MEEEVTAITGATIGSSGFFGWIDGIGDLALDYGGALLADQFPEQFSAPGKGEIRDSEVDALLAKEAAANDVIFGLGVVELSILAGAVVLVLIVVMKNR